MYLVLRLIFDFLRSVELGSECSEGKSKAFGLQGLPDGILANQKYLFWYVLTGVGEQNFWGAERKTYAALG
jgi:hypothetical protein